MRKLFLFAALVAAALSPLACDLVKKATSDTVMVATLLSAPARDISPEAFTGLSAADAGVALDAGRVTVPGSTAAVVFLGEFKGLDSPPSALDGAEVTVQAQGGAPLALPESSEGRYTLTGSGPQSPLTYQSGATYTFTATHDGEEYVGEVADAPALEHIPQLETPAGFLEHPANTPLSLARSSPPSGQDRNVAFVTVFPISAQGEKGNPTFSNMPSAPLDLLKLFANSSEFRRGTVEIPASAFPETHATYLVVFQGVRLGSATSSNLQLASALMAGTAQVGVVRTR